MSKSLTPPICMLTAGLPVFPAACMSFAQAPVPPSAVKGTYDSSSYPMNPDADDLDPALRKRLPTGASLRVLVETLGPAHGDACSGLYCPRWYFSDGHYVHAGQGPSGWSWGVGACESTPCVRRSPFERP